MKQIERDLEQKCAQYARTLGWACWKNENNCNKGIPDRSFLHPEGWFFMVEFKASPTAHVRPEQKVWAEHFPKTVYFVSDFDSFKKLVDELSGVF